MTALYPGNVAISGYSSYPVPVQNLFRVAAGVFMSYINKVVTPTNPIYANASLSVVISVTDPAVEMFTLDTDESYTLRITSNGTINVS